MRPRAVVFDLFQTLVPYDPEAGRVLYRRMAGYLGADPERFARAWVADRPRREAGRLADSVRAVCSAVGLMEFDVDALVAMRREATRATLLPRAGAVETLAELRARGFRIGLLSNCSGDVPDVWPKTALAPCFDATAFSCEIGVAKPEPRAYISACESVGLEPAACLFVDDQPGFARAAREVGMQAVVIDPPDGAQVDGWEGPRVAEPRELLELLA